MQANNRPLLDAVRERYTYNLGNGNYLVLEEVDSQHVRPKHSSSLYVRGSGAPNDLSTLANVCAFLGYKILQKVLQILPQMGVI